MIAVDGVELCTHIETAQAKATVSGKTLNKYTSVVEDAPLTPRHLVDRHADGAAHARSTGRTGHSVEMFLRIYSRWLEGDHDALQGNGVPADSSLALP